MLRQTHFIQRALTLFEERVKGSGACDEHLLRARLVETPLEQPVSNVVVTVADWIADPDGLFVADFDLLARMPGVETLDIVGTEGTLGSGFHQRVHEWLPGLEETTGSRDRRRRASVPARISAFPPARRPNSSGSCVGTGRRS